MKALRRSYLRHLRCRNAPAKENSELCFLILKDCFECAHLIDCFLPALHLNEKSPGFASGAVVEPHLTVNSAVRALFPIVP